MAKESKFFPEECTFITILRESPEISFPKETHNKHKTFLSTPGNNTLQTQITAKTSIKDPQKFQTLALSDREFK